jgi:NDP-sugar pyrophosphorylase family protein
VILAGGLGTRLRAVVSDRPKVLALVGGRPFLARLLEQLQLAHIPLVVLSTGHLGEQVEAEFGDTYRGMRLTYSREPVPLGTGGALRAALPAIASDPVLVLNGDSYCHTDLDGLWRSHAAHAATAHAATAHAAAASIVLTRVPDVSRFGSVTTDATLCVLRFDEKAAVTGEGWINAGIYLVARRMVEDIPVGHEVSLERDVFPRWLGTPFFAYRSDGPFLDIGTPESYAAAERFFA